MNAFIMGITMKSPFTETIELAEAAIRNADDKHDRFKPLLDELGVDSVVGNTMLLDWAHHSQSKRSEKKSQRYKRPILMRGIVI
ncbi:type III secretion protein [Vibrio sp. NH-UV-68]|uniref:type III secretion protein n=1 Tax=unclassified Vibrio TaxID=2614977 RepID=UPI0036F39AC9